jgi:hypothetical protein
MEKILMTIATGLPYTLAAMIVVYSLADSINSLVISVRHKWSIKEYVGDVIMELIILVVLIATLIFTQNYIWGK